MIDEKRLAIWLTDWQYGSFTDGEHDAEYAVIDRVLEMIEYLQHCNDGGQKDD